MSGSRSSDGESKGLFQDMETGIACVTRTHTDVKMYVSDADRSVFHCQSLAATCRPWVSDLFSPLSWVYWVDFFASLGIAYTAATMYLLGSVNFWTTWACFPVAVLALYRVSMFIHEIVHLRQRQLPGFRVAWNVLAGVPLLMPTFMYESHLTHHSSHHYGTHRDGEYLPLARGTVAYLLLFLTQIIYQPLFVFVRFLIGTPVSLLHPALRRWVLERASSLVINFHHRRVNLQQGPRNFDFWIEIACCLRAWALLMVIVLGVVPWTRAPKIFLLAMFALGLNHIRTMVAHRYRHDGATLSHDDQFLDSTNIVGGWLTEFLCPLGLRYHALHHLLPGIPYHYLGQAHRRLTLHLPAESPYHEVTYPRFMDVIHELWRAVRSPAMAKTVSERQAAREVA